MSLLTQARMGRQTNIKEIALPLVGGLKAFQGGRACLDTSANVVRPMISGNANLISVGEFAESLDLSAVTAGATSPVLISLDQELVLRWYDNATGSLAVTSANLYQNVYMLDDHTVQNSASGNSVAGRCWYLDPVNGVAIQKSSQ
jgi:hypothetical protein